MKFKELKKGKLYGDRDWVDTLEFKEMRNDNLATFIEWDYDKNGDGYRTDNVRYLTKSEVADLREV